MSDNFNSGVQLDPLSANWQTIQGLNAMQYYSQSARGTGTVKSGAIWVADTFSSDHYCEFYMNTGTSPCVRVQADGARYEADFYQYDDGEGGGYDAVRLYYVNASEGKTFLVTNKTYSVGSFGRWIWRLEAVGSTITIKTATSHGGAFTTELTATDTTLTGGAPGVITNFGQSLDDFYAGDL